MSFSYAGFLSGPKVRIFNGLASIFAPALLGEVCWAGRSELRSDMCDVVRRQKLSAEISLPRSIYYVWRRLRTMSVGSKDGRTIGPDLSGTKKSDRNPVARIDMLPFLTGIRRVCSLIIRPLLRRLRPRCLPDRLRTRGRSWAEPSGCPVCRNPVRPEATV